MKNRYLNLNNANAEIYLFGEIDAYFGMGKEQFLGILSKLSHQSISLYISSPGGNVDDALAMHDLIKNHSGSSTAILSGVVASSATLVACGAKHVIMSDNALYMIHNPWTIISGDAREMRKAAKLTEIFKERILDIYKKQCESNGKSIKRSQLSKMMDEETWLTAQEALNYGFINEIKKDARIKNAISMHDLQRRGYINMPIEKLQLLSISKQSKKMKLKEFKDVMIHAIKEGLQGIVQPNTSHVELKAQEIQEALEVKFNDAIQSQEQAIAALRNELTEKDNEIARLQGKSSITAPVSDPNAHAVLNAKEQIEEKLAKEFGFHQLKAYRNIQLQKNN